MTGMRSQRWIVLLAVALSALCGLFIAGIPHGQDQLHLKKLPTTTTVTTPTTVPGAGAATTSTTTTP
jgi:hypothetical protein